MALRRIQKELREMKTDPPINIDAEPEGADMFHWTGIILGPPYTPYETGVFYLDISFPPDYPHKPPHIIFKTRIYHPYVTARGVICLDILCCKWIPCFTIKKALSAINSMMINPDTGEQHCGIPDVLRQYKTDIAHFEKTAKEWTQRYAT